MCVCVCGGGGLSFNTHYLNSTLIWRTVSRQVDEVIPSDHLRISGDPMV